MGYRSDVYFKTTTEGFLIIKKLNDSIAIKTEQPLRCADKIAKTESGFYKIEFRDVKWYDSYPEVQAFMNGLEKLREQDIPFSYIRIGEDVTDLEHTVNYADDDDTPDEIITYEPTIDVNDDDWGHYEEVDLYEGGE